jgi:hypothetical protein
MLGDQALDPAESRKFVLEMAESFWSGAQQRASA